MNKFESVPEANHPSIAICFSSETFYIGRAQIAHLT